jgi:hypothetical protein
MPLRKSQALSMDSEREVTSVEGEVRISRVNLLMFMSYR